MPASFIQKLSIMNNYLIKQAREKLEIFGGIVNYVTENKS